MIRFIISTDSLPKTEADALTGVLSQLSYPFWHWIENFWLVLLPENEGATKTAKELHAEIVAKIPSMEPKTMLVMRLDAPATYWGRANKEAWDWMAVNKMGYPL